jgi:peptidyl-prolyl cis-trans isomerase D
MSNTINFPRWFFEKQNADNSQLAKISMVRKTYADIPDSSIKISDKEIADYISKHKDDYKQEESRSIEYVTFSAAPSATDSVDAKNKLLALKEEFDSTKDVQLLLAREGVTNYYPGYISSKTIQVPEKDSIFKTPVGHVYGPISMAGIIHSLK